MNTQIDFEEKVPTENVVLAFAPAKSNNKDVQEVFKDDIAKTIWLVVKKGHLVSENFSSNCLFLAGEIRRYRKELQDWIWLNAWLQHLDMIGSQEEFGKELLPYILGKKTISYTIKENSDQDAPGPHRD